jgi:hypothetical protein
MVVASIHKHISEIPGLKLRFKNGKRLAAGEKND